MKLGRLRRASMVLGAVACAACGDNFITTVNGSPRSQTISIEIGRELDIMLGIVGGQFEDPPHVSSDAVRYIDVSAVPPYSPGGPNLRFRFVGIARGTAIVTFRSGFPFFAVVEDTVVVR